MRKEALGHGLRLLLIAVLLFTALVLADATGYYDRVFEHFSGTGTEKTEDTDVLPGLSSAELAKAVRPRTVLVRTAEGATSVSAYAGSETEEAFHRFSAILGEALGSAGEPETIDEKTFREGLNAGCAWIDFFCEMPLEVLAQWLGGEMHSAAAQMRAQRLYLGLSDLTAQLVYQSADGGFYRCTTAAMSDALETRINEFSGGEAHFAFEDAALRQMQPYAVMLETLPQCAGVTGTSGRTEVSAEQLLQAAEMNRYLASTYTEADGTLVYIDNERSLRINPDGTVSFRTTGTESEARIADGLAAAVSYAYSVALQSIGSCAQQADILLTDISGDAQRGYTICFDYCIDGIPLRLASGNAARIVLRGGQLEEFRLSLRSYVRTEEPQLILPMRQAAAIAEAEGTAPALVYIDSGERVTCMWMKES